MKIEIYNDGYDGLKRIAIRTMCGNRVKYCGRWWVVKKRDGLWQLAYEEAATL
jgi:hypothetical protein